MITPDYESVALGLRAPPAKAKASRNDHIDLSYPEATVISRLPNSSEYNVILRIMEGVIEKLETEHLQTWSNKELFERTGLFAVAARTFYERVQIEINYHASEFRGELEAATMNKEVEGMTPEEMVRRGFGLDE